MAREFRKALCLGLVLVGADVLAESQAVERCRGLRALEWATLVRACPAACCDIYEEEVCKSGHTLGERARQEAESQRTGIWFMGHSNRIVGRPYDPRSEKIISPLAGTRTACVCQLACMERRGPSAQEGRDR